MNNIESRELDEFFECVYGGTPSPELLEMACDAARRIVEYVVTTDDWFPRNASNMVRIKIQSMLVDYAAGVVNLDRQSEGPDFFGTVTVPGKPLPPELRLRRVKPLTRQLQALRTRKNGWQSNGRH